MKSLSNSKIIKSDFVSIMDQKKPIETIDNRHKRIVNKVVDEEEEEEEEQVESENENDQFEQASPENAALTQDISAPEVEQLSEEDIIEEAKHKAYLIIEKAKETAEIEAEMILEKAQEEGYLRGKQEADGELQKDQEQFLAEREAEVEAYKSLVNAIEPKMVGLVISLVEKMIGYCTVEEEVISFIIKKGFEELELTGHIVVKVSEADFDSVIQNQSKIFKNMSARTTTEVLLDYNLSRNDCIIETNMGNINCSLDTQFKALKAELTLIQQSLVKE
ncbi:MAG: FliH/SctL family protein [Vallitaleaceae bacterium]|jgi:flagellar assembly protein FliH|nr:FliH/SctL family protein [Vallitaleaceae bacterium]